MACPYFYPTEPMPSGQWPHPGRLPLGGGWRGRCTAISHEPEDRIVQEYCNLGYARDCPSLPPDRHADAVRFAVGETDGDINVFYVCERAHAPAAHGRLRFDPATNACEGSDDPCLRRMAECVVMARAKR